MWHAYGLHLFQDFQDVYRGWMVGASRSCAGLMAEARYCGMATPASLESSASNRHRSIWQPCISSCTFQSAGNPRKIRHVVLDGKTWLALTAGPGIWLMLSLHRSNLLYDGIIGLLAHLNKSAPCCAVALVQLKGSLQYNRVQQRVELKPL